MQLWAVEPLEHLGNRSGGGGGDDDADDDRTAAALPLGELRLDGGDAVTFASPMDREPYVLLGCRSGAVRVAMMSNASGCAVTVARQVRGLKLMPHSSEWSLGVWELRCGD